MTYRAANLLPDGHCFFGSAGGCSTGFYCGLNVNTKSDDDPVRVAANLQKAASVFGLDASRLHLLNQGVSANVAYVAEPTQDQMTADGVVTDQKNIVLCIRTADCAPVLLADYAKGIIGAAHAGWRGAFAGVIENTLALMVEKGASLSRIAAAVGPCIGQKSYEVDDAFFRQFCDKDAGYATFFATGRAGHYLFDLEGFCRARLEAAGVFNVSVSGQDTYALPAQYYSFRRFTHQGLVKKTKCFPTELSGIVLRG